MNFNQNPPLPYSWRKKKGKKLDRKGILDIKSCSESVEHYMMKYQKSRSTIQNIQNGKTYSEVE